MSEPREWWIDPMEHSGRYASKSGRYTAWDDRQRGIHVIEFSAYEALRAECESLREDLRMVRESIHKQYALNDKSYQEKCKLLEAGRGLVEVMKHAVAIGYLNPGGSTEGSFKRVLAKYGRIFEDDGGREVVTEK